VALRHGVTVDGHLLAVAHLPLSTDVPAPRPVMSFHVLLPRGTHMPFFAVFTCPITKLTVTSMAFHMQTAETLPKSSVLQGAFIRALKEHPSATLSLNAVIAA
jgi:hypothetical protein